MLLENRLTYLQRLQDAARNGYAYFVTGEVDLAKWPAMESKFDGLYNISMPKSTRAKRRKSGEAVCLLYGYQSNFNLGMARVAWTLVVTEGKGRVHGREQLKLLKVDRITVAGYELVHDGVSWSWKMTTARVRYWRERISSIAALQPERRRLAKTSSGDQH